MEFIGENGVAAPRLKDAGLPMARMRQAYTGGRATAWSCGSMSSLHLPTCSCPLSSPHCTLIVPPHLSYHVCCPAPSLPPWPADMVVMVRQLYQRCRLVHADLSGVCGVQRAVVVATAQRQPQPVQETSLPS